MMLKYFTLKGFATPSGGCSNVIMNETKTLKRADKRPARVGVHHNKDVK